MRIQRSWVMVAGMLLSIWNAGTSAYAVDATAEWNPNSEPDLAGYRLFRSDDSLLGTTVADAKNNTAVTKSVVAVGTEVAVVTNLSLDHTYYFRLTAFDQSGNESGFNVDGSGNPVEAVFRSTASRTPTRTLTSTRTPTRTPTPNRTFTATATRTATAMATQISTATATQTATAMATQISTAMATRTATATATRTATATATRTATAMATRTATATATRTATATATRTATATATRTATATATRTATAMATQISTAMATRTTTVMATRTATATATRTAVPMQTPGPDKRTESILSPNHDGINDMVRFDPEVVELTVLDMKGRVVYHAYQDGGVGPWSGLDGGGQESPSGAYILKLRKRSGTQEIQRCVIVK